MHGIVHRTLKEYIIEKTDEGGWHAVCDRAGVEPELYLLVSYYPDAEIENLLEALSTMSGYDRPLLERDFGRRLGPALLDMFRAHLRDDWSIEDVLLSLERVTTEVAEKKTETTVPRISGERVRDHIEVTYDSQRGYCAVAQGVLESIAFSYDDSAEIEKRACVDEGADACRFAVFV